MKRRLRKHLWQLVFLGLTWAHLPIADPLSRPQGTWSGCVELKESREKCHHAVTLSSQESTVSFLVLDNRLDLEQLEGQTTQSICLLSFQWGELGKMSSCLTVLWERNQKWWGLPMIQKSFWLPTGKGNFHKEFSIRCLSLRVSRCSLLAELRAKWIRSFSVAQYS